MSTAKSKLDHSGAILVAHRYIKVSETRQAFTQGANSSLLQPCSSEAGAMVPE